MKQKRHHKVVHHSEFGGSLSSPPFGSGRMAPRPNLHPEIGTVVNNADSPRLTKQQKRDLKRKAKAAASFQKRTSTAVEEGAAVGVGTMRAVSVYKRKPRLPPTALPPALQQRVAAVGPRFLVPTDGSTYADVCNLLYQDFHVDPPTQFSEDDFHTHFRKSLEGLENQRCYQFDYIQPGGLGTKVTRTYVTRCLVGCAGITYKYLGLRMFAFPWIPGEIGCTDELAEIGRLNAVLADRTLSILQDSKKTEPYGSHRYNLTLINRCFADDGSSQVVLKEEPLFGNDRITVSWHADSSLQHYSSIAVYHFTNAKSNGNGKSEGRGQQDCDEDQSWRIALKVSPNAEGPGVGKLKAPSSAANEDRATSSLPALAIPLASGSVYYLLDEFNHHHQHSVLAGQTERYASTHRVSREHGHTYSYIRDKCQSALNEGGAATAKVIRSQQLCLQELEFEWIRQFYIQGRRHHDLHVWWHGPMTELIRLWTQLENQTCKCIQILLDAVKDELWAQDAATSDLLVRRDRKKLMKRKKAIEAVEQQSYTEMISFLEEKITRREGWVARENDVIYKNIDRSVAPMTPPLPEMDHPLLHLDELKKSQLEWKKKNRPFC